MTENAMESSSVEALVNMQMGWMSPQRPQRNRKRNRLIFNESELTSDDQIRSHKSGISSPDRSISSSSSAVTSKSLASPLRIRMKTAPHLETSKIAQANLDKTVAKNVGTRLRNLLKLPKAHKMCMFEWFYSHLDSVLFGGDNDFCLCLKESFPELKTKKLTRAHWAKVRRLMGKPRRCSEAFFEEERAALDSKRNRIRKLQQRKIARDDADQWTDLPKEVPMPLVVGTNVTARLRGAHDGLFTGQIDAVDISNESYRVTFDRSNLGTHSVPDIEVASCDQQETINLLSLMERKRHLPSHRHYSSFFNPAHTDLDSSLQSPAKEHDPVLGRSPLRSKLLVATPNQVGGTLGGFPVNLLRQIARLSRVLAMKREKIKNLAEMNTGAEKANSYGEPLTLEFQRKYATIILDLERLNKDLNELLLGVQKFCLELYPEQSLPNDQSSYLRQQCMATSEEMVASKNVGNEDAISPRRAVRNVELTDLISQLTALMVQVKCLKESKGTSLEYKSLIDAVKDIKLKISPENAGCFQSNVEIHIAHIRSGMEEINY